MYLGTLESDFARSIGILVGLSAILFASQGILLPQASYYGQVIFFGLDMLRGMQFVGLFGGIFALVGIRVKSTDLQRVSFAFLSWFYMMFFFVLLWLVGLQAPSVVLSLIMVLLASAIYGYLTQRGKNDADTNGGAYRKGALRKNIPRSNKSSRPIKR